MEKKGWLVGPGGLGVSKSFFFFVSRPQKVAKKNFLPTYLNKSTQNMRSNLVAGNTFLTSASRILLACQLRHAASTLLMLSSCRECCLFFLFLFFPFYLSFFPCLPKVLPARGASASVEVISTHGYLPAREICV